jgi:hypothetical protein
MAGLCNALGEDEEVLQHIKMNKITEYYERTILQENTLQGYHLAVCEPL